jgi:hypothetical protein
MVFEYIRCTKFQGADYDTDRYLVVAIFRERLPVRKPAAQNFSGERFNLTKLNEIEFRKQCEFEI